MKKRMNAGSNYRRAYNILLGIVDIVTFSMKYFRQFDDEICLIHGGLKRAVIESSEMMLEDEIASCEKCKKAYTVLFDAINHAMEYAKEHREIENVEAVYKCLSLITSASVIWTYPLENTHAAILGLEKVINAIFQSLKWDKYEDYKSVADTVDNCVGVVIPMPKIMLLSSKNPRVLANKIP